MSVSEDDLLRMVGLDAYMMVRYLNACFRVSVFLSFFGIVILVPIYASAPGIFIAWNRYTLANVPSDANSKQLWAPVVFSYFFAAYYCYLMHNEYSNFMTKRLQYLVEGDPDTPIQTHHTIMIEQLPPDLRSTTKLYQFFNKLFPGAMMPILVSRTFFFSLPYPSPRLPSYF